jgi:hypothetical protein
MTTHPIRSAALRRWYFASLLGGAAVLLLARLLIFPADAQQATWRLTIGAVLDTLFAAAIASIILGIVIVLLFADDPAEVLEVVESREIARLIKQEASRARQWDVRARTANYFSNTTLPALREAALDGGWACRVRMQVLDPENDALLAAYARFRSNHPGQVAAWSVERVRCEIYAALLQVSLCRSEAPRLEVKIGLSPAFWVVSLDLTDRLALLTGQDRGEPALTHRSPSSFYSSWQDDFDASFTECRTLEPGPCTIPRAELQSPSAEIIDELGRLFEGWGFTKCSADILPKVLQQVGGASHYA